MKKIVRPKISILMCVYNEEKFIKNAIDSVLSQSYKNFEMTKIISDHVAIGGGVIGFNTTDFLIKKIINDC